MLATLNARESLRKASNDYTSNMSSLVFHREPLVSESAHRSADVAALEASNSFRREDMQFASRIGMRSIHAELEVSKVPFSILTNDIPHSNSEAPGAKRSSEPCLKSESAE
jgi:hypothetical protein